MPANKDTALGRLAVERGFITQEQFNEALANQHKIREDMGIEQGLEPILVGKKWLTPDQVHELNNAAAVETGEARLVAGYEVVAKLGRGGMGAVYKARRADGAGYVALKILPPSLANEAMIARFKRESEIVRKLNHENIVGCVEFGYDKRRKCHFCALELVEGEDLAKRLKRLGKLSEDEAVAITIQMAGALQHAYKNGLVHRDVKPENIMVTTDGTAKLLDLGLARQASKEATRLTESGLFVGSPYYASPEQALGREELDIRADIYALGATLYHMVTGKPPFVGATQMEILQKHVGEKLPWPGDVNPDVSEDVCSIITKMMAKNPDDRYETPNDLHRDLDLLIEGKEPAAARAKTKSSIARAARPRSKKARRRSPERYKKARSSADRHGAGRSGARHRRHVPITHAADRDHVHDEIPEEGSPSSQMKLAVLVGGGLGAVALLAIYFVHASMRPKPKPDLARREARTEPERAAAPIEKRASVAPVTAKKPTPAPASREKPPAPKPAVRTAASAFRKAVDYEAAHPRDHAGAIALFKAVVKDFPGTFQAGEARLNLLRLGSVAGVKVSLPAEGAAPAKAPPDAIAFGGHAYKLFTREKAWHEAKQFCEEQGGHLVTITSKEENDFVTNLARQGEGSVWLGISDEREEGKWEWVTGEKPVFSAWAEGEPNNANGNEDCGQLYAGGRYAWNDQGSKDPSLFICEWEPAAVAKAAGDEPAEGPGEAPTGLARGLVGHWTFDEPEGELARDASGKGNHGTIKGALRAPGRTGSALALAGARHYVEIPNSASLTPAESVTVALWMKPSRTIRPGFLYYPNLVSKGNDSYCLHIDRNTGQMKMALNGKMFPSRTSQWNEDEWYHVAVTLGEGSVRFYVNGVGEDTMPGPRRLSPNAKNLVLGKFYVSHPTSNFPGLIDDVRIYERALSGDEMKSLASAEPAAGEPRIAEVAPPGELPKEGLQLWFDAQDVDGNGKPDAFADGSLLIRWMDKSGKGRAAARIEGAGRPVYKAAGAGGKAAVRFDGIDDCLKFDYDPNGLTGMTIFVVSSCAKDVSAGGTHNLRAAIWWGEKGGWGNVVVCPFLGEVGARFGTGQTSNMLAYRRPAPLKAGELTLTTTVHDGPAGTDYVYVDGTRVVAATGKRSTLAHHDTKGHLGASAYGGARFNTFFPGDIGEILVYSRTLPDAERRAVEAYLILRWSLPGAEKLSKLDAKRVAKKAAADEAARRRDAFERLLDEIDPLAENGDFAAARKRLEKAKAQPQFAANAEKIAAALRVCKVLEDRAKAAAAGAKALVGTVVELRARRGRRRGEVKQVTDAGIVLVTKYKIGGKEFEKPVTVGWPTLAPDQVDEFAGKGGWKTAGPDGAVARAYLALGRKDNDGATKALEQAGDHPLAVHLRRKLGAPAEKVAAKKAAMAVPGGWPKNRKGLVFAWESAGKPVILMNPATGRAFPCSLRARGNAKMHAGGSMDLDKGAYLVEGADKLLLAACKATNALTIETRMFPRGLKQGGPARIISFSQDQANRNFTLGQSGGKLGLRLRTPQTGVNGAKPASTLCDLPKAGPCHVIVSYSPGRLVCYLDGRKVLETDKVQGDFSNWEPMHFLLGDEWSGDRDWEGSLRGIAIYNRFMSEAEAASSFRNSPRPRAVPAAAKTKKWKSIFNGEDMTGWSKHGGKAYVDEGALVADDNADLLYRASWSEFTLDFEARGKAFGLNLAHAKPGRGAPHRVNLVFHKDGDLHVRRDGKRLWKSGGGKFTHKEWTPVRLALSKGGLKIYRGEKLIGKIDLPRAERKGGIYFYSHGGKAMIRKVRVRLPESGT